jgi:hypothetical protein
MTEAGAFVVICPHISRLRARHDPDRGPDDGRGSDGATGRLSHAGARRAHTHAVVIGTRIGADVRVYAGLVAEETGLQQFLDAVVLPWFSRRAPWVLSPSGKERLLHRYDPAMDPSEGGDIAQNGVLRIRRALDGARHYR